MPRVSSITGMSADPSSPTDRSTIVGNDQSTAFITMASAAARDMGAVSARRTPSSAPPWREVARPMPRIMPGTLMAIMRTAANEMASSPNAKAEMASPALPTLPYALLIATALTRDRSRPSRRAMRAARMAAAAIATQAAPTRRKTTDRSSAASAKTSSTNAAPSTQKARRESVCTSKSRRRPAIHPTPTMRTTGPITSTSNSATDIRAPYGNDR